MRRCIGECFAAAVLLAGCGRNVESASEKFNELPPAVQKTVRTEAPNAEIQSVAHTARDGASLYTIDFRENGRKGRMVVAANGFLLNDNERNTWGVNSNSLTPTGPTAESPHSYTTSATAGNNNALAPTGVVGTPFSALPLVVQQTIQTQAPGLQIARISRHEDMGRVIYTVEFNDKGKNPTIRVAEDGALVQTLRK